MTMECKLQAQYNQVKEFMLACDQTINTDLTFPSTKVGNLRIDLIDEEIDELNRLGFEKDNPVEVLDALCDILYVGLGAMITLGTEKYTSGDFHLTNESFIAKMLPMPIAQSRVRRLTDSVEQFKRGLNYGDWEAVLNSLNSLMYHTYATAYNCGFDLSSAFNEVHASNMSKFCSSVEEAKKHCFDVSTSSNPKAALYSSVDLVPVTVNGKDIVVIKGKSNGKVLKGPSFFEPDLQKFI